MHPDPQIHVLLVEDHEGSRREIERFLTDAGHRVTAVADAETAEKALPSAGLSVVVSDYKLPGMDGIELVRRIKRQVPSLPCLLVTAHGDVTSAIEAMQAGAFNFLEKPVTPEVLDGLIRVAHEKYHLSLQVEQLRRQLDERYGLEHIIGSSPPMRSLFEKIRLAAPTNSTVLIVGESGTGKELVARAVHQNSLRAQGPFVVVNCAALPETLVESELFGHEKGAFTGAVSAQEGFFEAAETGTLFVDEIGDLSFPLQMKLLRALEQRVITRVGSTREVPVDVRIIAATNRDLHEMVRERTFREDLFFRLSVLCLALPPLRERSGDIPLLVAHFLGRLSGEHRREVKSIAPEALDALEHYSWPGNVRELRNVLESMVVLNTRGCIDLEDLPPEVLRGEEDSGTLPAASNSAERSPGAMRTLADIEKQTIFDALRACGGNRTRAAQTLGIGLRTIQRKLKEYGEADNPFSVSPTP
jgi:DNA-binding NtrC family response regulator